MKRSCDLHARTNMYNVYVGGAHYNYVRLKHTGQWNYNAGVQWADCRSAVAGLRVGNAFGRWWRRERA